MAILSRTFQSVQNYTYLTLHGIYIYTHMCEKMVGWKIKGLFNSYLLPSMCTYFPFFWKLRCWEVAKVNRITEVTWQRFYLFNLPILIFTYYLWYVQGLECIPGIRQTAQPLGFKTVALCSVTCMQSISLLLITLSSLPIGINTFFKERYYPDCQLLFLWRRFLWMNRELDYPVCLDVSTFNSTKIFWKESNLVVWSVSP